MFLSERRLGKMQGRILTGTVVLAGLFSAYVVFAYNPFQDQVNGAPVPTRWPNASVTWNLNRTTGANVDTTSGTNSVSLDTAGSDGIDVWQNTNLALDQQQSLLLNDLTLTRGANSTLSDPNTSDCINVISFSPSSAVSFPTGAIAFTQVVTATGTPPFTYTCTSGGTTTTKTSDLPSVIIDADMVFNPKESFSTSTPPLPNHFDVRSTVSHEFGHLLGLDHSGIAHTMMFPFGDTGAGQQRDLAVDDVVGVAFLYPNQPTFDSSTGIISGTVTLNGSGIFAAHVVAVDATTGAAVVDGLTNPDGTYNLLGVLPGTYNVLALPLSGVYTLDSFSGWSCGYGENSPPCCDPKTDNTCTGTAQKPPTNHTGKFF